MYFKTLFYFQSKTLIKPSNLKLVITFYVEHLTLSIIVQTCFQISDLFMSAFCSECCIPDVPTNPAASASVRLSCLESE